MTTNAVLPEDAQTILKSFEGDNDYRPIICQQRQPLRVLIIDDDPIDFQILERCMTKLRRYDVTAFHAKDVSAARSIAASNSIDIAFVDYNLGIECGLRAIKHIGGRCGDCPVVLISGLAGHHIQELAISAGAINHLDKNHLSASVLEGTIQSTLYTFQIEKQLQNTVMKLDQANRAKENFFAHMSHDLKTPLNAILGYSEALKLGALGTIDSNRARDGINNINEAGNRLLETINNLISRISNGEYMDETTFEYTNVSKVVAQSVESVAVFAKSKDHEITVTHDDPHLFFDCNVEQLTLALTNLLTNAIKYSPNGGTISIKTEVDSENLQITIADEGIGMTSDEIKTALKNKGRVDLPADIAREGTGIGLTIVKSAIKCHKGKLTVDSELGRGSRFKMIIPLNQ